MQIGQRPHTRNLWGWTKVVILNLLATAVLTEVLPAQVQSSLPQPIPLPKPTETPKDIPYPGVVELHIDATDVLRRVYRIRELMPVVGHGLHTFLFPEWTPGDHAPNEPLEKMAGLIITAKGSRVHWIRDTVDVHAFHVDVPAGVTQLEMQYEYLGSTGPDTGPVLITPTMLDLQWQSVILYPAGHFIRDVRYHPSVTLPSGWAYLTSLDGGVTAPQPGENTVTFPTIALDALIDQPVMAGRYLKQIVLTETPAPVRLDVAAESPENLSALSEVAKHFVALMPQANRLFGSHHYDHYDHMLFLSDELSTYFEHHRSGENSAPANFLKPSPNSTATAADLSFIVHGYVHSWNGMYRRPAEMWTPNLNTPERDSMLWVFEGLTDYWADVLSFRAGFYSHDNIDEQFSGLAATMTLDAGADWRSLEDTNNDAVILARRPASWPSWQRNMFDPYDSGEMIWLEADAIIRQESAGNRSLDDFARSFFGGGSDSGNVTKTYTFDAMLASLTAVQPYDWHSFFRSHLDDYGQGRLIHSIERTGYQLVFTDKSPGSSPPSGPLDLAYSLGMRVSPSGAIYAVHWGGPAFNANLTIGETIVSVNGKPYAPGVLVDAIRAAESSGPLDLVVKRGRWQHPASIIWNGGMRYPHLKRLPDNAPLLDEILAPISSTVVQ